MLVNLIRKTFSSNLLIATIVILFNNHTTVIPATKSNEDKEIQEAINRSLEEEVIRESIRLEKERQIKARKRIESEQEEKAQHALQQAIKESLLEQEKTRLKRIENTDLEKAIRLSLEHQREQKIQEEEDAIERANLEEAIRLSLEQEEKKEKEEVKEVPIHDVIILLDTLEKAKEKSPGAITNTFAAALCEKTSPIITSSHTLKNYLNSIEIVNDYIQLQCKNEFYNLLDDKFWDFYRVRTKEQSLYLLIPKDYSKKLNEKFNTEEFRNNCKKYPKYTPEEIIIGFRIDPAAKIFKKISSHKLKNKVELTPDYSPEVHLLEQLFIQGKDEIFGLWNIFLEGHGNFAKQNLIDIASIKTAPQIDTSGALIAGLDVTNFRNLIQFLSKNINTNFLYYLSCFSGGYNIFLPYITNLMNKKGNVIGGIEKPNFTVVTGALTDQIFLNATDFKVFFELLHKYTKKIGVHPTIFKDSELVDILKDIISNTDAKDPFGIMGLPQIMQPKTGIFRAIPLNENIGIISEFLALKHKIENKQIILNNKKAILIYPKEIETKVQIQAGEGKTIPAIVSMLPGIGIHKFESISTSLSFLELISSFAATEPAFEKYFYIKQLELINDEYCISTKAPDNVIVLNNVIIKVAKKSIDIIFSDDEKNIYLNEFTKKIGLQKTSTKLGHRWKFSNKYKADEFINAIYNYFVLPKSAEINLMLNKAFNPKSLFSLLPSKELRNLTKIKE